MTLGWMFARDNTKVNQYIVAFMFRWTITRFTLEWMNTRDTVKFDQ